MPKDVDSVIVNFELVLDCRRHRKVAVVIWESVGYLDVFRDANPHFRTYVIASNDVRKRSYVTRSRPPEVARHNMPTPIHAAVNIGLRSSQYAVGPLPVLRDTIK